MPEVVFHRLATREVRAAYKWYAARSTHAQNRFLRAMNDAVNRITSDPRSHAALGDLYRYVRLPRFPYILIYE
jgi:plasmid stabilization system protein ParE